MAESQGAAAETTLVTGWDLSLNIHQRIFVACHAIEKLEKDGRVKLGKDGGFDYITHDQTTFKVKRALLGVGVMVVPTVVKHDKDGNRTELTVRAKFVNVDDPQDFIEVEGVGYGVDSSDKGPGKAYSYAMKYVYMKLFMLNSADDIEEDQTRHEPEVSSRQLTDAETTAREAIGEWATAYKAALENAPTIAVLKEIKKDHRKRINSNDVPQNTRDFFDELFETREMHLKNFEGQAG